MDMFEMGPHTPIEDFPRLVAGILDMRPRGVAISLLLHYQITQRPDGELGADGRAYMENIARKLDAVVQTPDGEISTERSMHLAHAMLAYEMPVQGAQLAALSRALTTSARASLASREMARVHTPPDPFDEAYIAPPGTRTRKQRKNRKKLERRREAVFSHNLFGDTANERAAQTMPHVGDYIMRQLSEHCMDPLMVGEESSDGAGDGAEKNERLPPHLTRTLDVMREMRMVEDKMRKAQEEFDARSAQPREPTSKRMATDALIDGTVYGVVIITGDNAHQLFTLPDDAHCTTIAHWFVTISRDDVRIAGTVYIVSNHEMIPCMIPPGSTPEQAGAHVVRVGESMRKVIMDKQKLDALLVEQLQQDKDMTREILDAIQCEAANTPDNCTLVKERGDLARRWREYTEKKHLMETESCCTMDTQVVVDTQQITYTTAQRAILAQRYKVETDRLGLEMERCNLEECELALARGWDPRPKSPARTTTVHCIICMAQERSVLLTPCNHVCVCRGCWDQWRAKRVMHTPCPMCRAAVESATDVYL